MYLVGIYRPKKVVFGQPKIGLLKARKYSIIGNWFSRDFWMPGNY